MRILLSLLLLTVLVSPCAAAAAESVKATVYKDPNCGCCHNYVSYLRENGFAVEVVDTGDLSSIKRQSGVPEDLLPNLFDPFVTTKQTGSGLGLALVAKIVGDHGGIIECESQPRKTTFRVLMPMFNPAKQFDQSNRDGVPGTLPPASQDAR